MYNIIAIGGNSICIVAWSYCYGTRLQGLYGCVVPCSWWRSSMNCNMKQRWSPC